MRNSEITEHVNNSVQMQFLFIPSELSEAIGIIDLKNSRDFNVIVEKMIGKEYRRFCFKLPSLHFPNICCWHSLRGSKEKLNIFASMICPGKIYGNAILSRKSHGLDPDLLGLSKEDLMAFSEYLKWVRKETPRLQWSKENSGEIKV